MKGLAYATTGLVDLDVSRKRIIRTTLYDLIETLTNEVQSGEENLMLAAVLDLMKSRRVRWVRRTSPLKWAH